MTVDELAAYLRVHKSTIYRLVRNGKLPAFKLGDSWRFNIEDVDQWRLKAAKANGVIDDEGPEK